MSSFIQEIKISTTPSLDVIMRNGNAYRYIGIDPELLLVTQVVIANEIDKADTYFYDVTLSSKEEETELSEDDREPSESDNVTDEGKDQDDKTMVLQALNLLEKVIGEKGYADTDILIKTIRDYIEKQTKTRGVLPLFCFSTTQKNNQNKVKSVDRN